MTDKLVPHKHAKVIKAWAEGRQVQVYLTCSNKWETLDNNSKWISWSEDLKYRIKPKTIEVKYRRFLWKHGNGNVAVYVESADVTPGVNEKSLHFVKWIDKEWQIYSFEDDYEV